MGGKRVFDEEEHEDEMRPVELPSGALFRVHLLEQDYFSDRVHRYLSDNQFTNVSDLQDLDRVMIGELLIWRWGQWLMQGRNYWNEAIDDSALQKQIKELSGELRLVKSALALDKVSRDRQKGEDSVPAFIANLRKRAKQFGYKRNEEFAKVLEMFHDLRAMITLYDNCTDDELRERKITNVNEDGVEVLVPLSHSSIVAWFRDIKCPEFDEIDRKFRQDGPDAQKMWNTDL